MSMRIQIVRLGCSEWHVDHLTTPDRQAAALLSGRRFHVSVAAGFSGFSRRSSRPPTARSIGSRKDRPLGEESLELLYLLSMKPQYFHEMRVQVSVEDVENGRLDHLDQLGLIGCRGCDRLLDAEIHATFIDETFVLGGPRSCLSPGDFLVKQDTNRHLVQLCLKNQVCNARLGHLTDVCERLGGCALSFQQGFEKGNYFFMGPIAEIAGIDFMHPARG